MFRCMKFGIIALSVGLIWAPADSWAEVFDLTTPPGGASEEIGAVIGGVFVVTQINPSSTGTGVIDSFVRIQSNNSEDGYNTDDGTPLDTKGGNFTHAITLGSVPTVTIDGFVYRQFLLDINQNTGGTHELITLNQIQIFLAGSDMLHSGLTDATATTPPVISFAGATEVFRMNNAAVGFNQILLDYSLNNGSGSGDMFLYVLDSAFDVDNDPLTDHDDLNLILYSQFGDPPTGSGSNDGFEEWAVLLPEGSPDPNPEPAPEPTSLAIWCLGMVAAGIVARRMRKQK